MKAIRGADTIVYINGKPFALATAVDWTISYGRRAIYGIDKHTPQELASGQSRILVNIHCIRTEMSAGIEGAGAVPIEENLLSERYFFLQLVHRKTDTVFLQIPNASVNTQRWAVSEKGLLTGSFECEGLSFGNEF